jgi:myo-inositol-1(or 4)-monophosphatase
MELESIASATAAGAAELVRAKLGRTRVLDTKSTPTDVVTEADLEVETFIRERLWRSSPGASIQGEEHGSTGGATSIGWIVDPIDGTVNFLYDLPAVSVSIAATIDGEIVAGAVADVVRREVFSARLGGGARRDGASISPSTATTLDHSLVGTGFSYDSDMRRREGEIVGRVLPAARDVRGFGSSALHLCWVGCGRLDGYYQHGVKAWDMAAGALIASEAGARVEATDGPQGSLVVATSAGIFEALALLVN